MPRLPSGLGLAIGHQAIPETMGTGWGTYRRGYFWYRRSDESITPPPYDGSAEILEDFVQTPIPKDIDEAKRYVWVLRELPNGRFQWQGEWLDTFPRFTALSDDDKAAWQSWLAEESTESFLRQVIAKCRRQAELHLVASGVSKVYPADFVEPDAEMLARELELQSACREIMGIVHHSGLEGLRNSHFAGARTLLTRLGFFKWVLRDFVRSMPTTELILFGKALAILEDTTDGLGSVTPLEFLVGDGRHPFERELLAWILDNTKNAYRYYTYGAKNYQDYLDKLRQRAERAAAKEQHDAAARASTATPKLFGAVRRRDEKAVRALLDRGADPYVTTPDGADLLGLAVAGGNQPIIEALNEARQRVDGRSETGRTK